MSEWISVEDRLPRGDEFDHYNMVIVWDSYHEQAVTAYPHRFALQKGLTHWMPTGLTKPEPPQ